MKHYAFTINLIRFDTLSYRRYQSVMAFATFEPQESIIIHRQSTIKIRAIQLPSNTQASQSAATNAGCKFNSGTLKQKYSLKHKLPSVTNAPPVPIHANLKAHIIVQAM